jgi:hypothetical protein
MTVFYLNLSDPGCNSKFVFVHISLHAVYTFCNSKFVFD